jgi:hypothetical protein
MKWGINYQIPKSVALSEWFAKKMTICTCIIGDMGE